MVGRATKMVKVPALHNLLSVILVFAAVCTLCTTKWSSCHAFTSVPSATSFATKTKHRIAIISAMTKTKTATPFFFAEETANRQQKEQLSDAENTALSSLQEQQSSSTETSTATRRQQSLFDDSTLAEANDALKSVGWGGMALMSDGEKKDDEAALTSDDPFVKRIDASIREETGVGLEELLNPAKVCFDACMYV